MPEPFPEIVIQDWEKLQHYKNRNPPWIRIYRDLVDQKEWRQLSDGAAKLLIELYLMASESHPGGSVTYDLPGICWRTGRPVQDFDTLRPLVFELESLGFVKLMGASKSASKDASNSASKEPEKDPPETDASTNASTDASMSGPQRQRQSTDIKKRTTTKETLGTGNAAPPPGYVKILRSLNIGGLPPAEGDDRDGFFLVNLAEWARFESDFGFPHSEQPADPVITSQETLDGWLGVRA